MARIEKSEATSEEISQMKGEVITAVKKANKKRRPKLGCCSLIIVIILALAGYIAWTVASTGLITIPIFSKFAYEKPEPSYLVSEGDPIENVIEKTVQDEVTGRLLSGDKQLTNRSVSLILSESAFTSSLRQSLKNTEQSAFIIEESQIAISEENAIELFLPFKRDGKESVIMANIQIEAVDGQFSVVRVEAWIGKWHIPSWLSNTLLGKVVDQGLSEANSAIGRYASVEKIDYQKGQVELTGTITEDVLEL